MTRMRREINMHVQVRNRTLRDGTVFYDVDILDDSTTIRVGTYSSKARANEVVEAILKVKTKEGE